eukprot:m.174852 g.174852  ORF g.174852 m.174852 type:complete len:60 (+) comp18339_c0_seq1:155-334(+)
MEFLFDAEWVRARVSAVWARVVCTTALPMGHMRSEALTSKVFSCAVHQKVDFFRFSTGD